MITSHLIETFLLTPRFPRTSIYCVCVCAEAKLIKLLFVSALGHSHRQFDSRAAEKDRFLKLERVDFYAVDLLLSSTLQAQQ